MRNIHQFHQNSQLIPLHNLSIIFLFTFSCFFLYDKKKFFRRTYGKIILTIYIHFLHHRQSQKKKSWTVDNHWVPFFSFLIYKVFHINQRNFSYLLLLGTNEVPIIARKFISFTVDFSENIKKIKFNKKMKTCFFFGRIKSEEIKLALSEICA